MTSAQRLYRARVFAEVNRVSRSRNMRPLGSITWGTRTRGMGFVTAGGAVSDFNTAPINSIVSIQPFPEPMVPLNRLSNPDTLPGVWPGLNPSPANPAPVQANGGPAQVPVIVTPTSGPIPSPATVAAAAAAPVSWLDQQMISGIPNSYLLLGAIGALFLFGDKKK